MQDAIIKLKALGQMPDAIEDDPTEETIDVYDKLLSSVENQLQKKRQKY